MADYFIPTVIQPAIPADDITPLERLLLNHIFYAEPDGDRLYFSADERPAEKLGIPVCRCDQPAAKNMSGAT